LPLIGSVDTRIAWAVTELEQRLAEPLDLSQLAAAVNLSRSRFGHLFLHSMGISPARYLRRRRLERARELLETTFITVKEVMARVGCNDPSHFARDFRRMYGRGPREWRTTLSSELSDLPSSITRVESAER